MSLEQAVTDLEQRNAELVSEVVRARDAVMGLANMYTTITLGLAGTADGQYFTVPGNGAYQKLYQHDGAQAPLIATYPSKEQADADLATAEATLADALVNVDSAITDHVALPDPHTQYLKESEYEAHRSREDLLKQATLSLDFANNKYEVYQGPVNSLTQMPFNTALDFTRTSAATAINATGKMVDVGAGDQRLIGNREGLLIEEQRTNLLLDPTRMSDFGGQRLIKIPYSDVDPRDTLNAVLLTSNSTGSGYSFNGSTSVGAGETYTFSCFYKAAATSIAVFGFYGGSDRAVIDATQVTADLSDGTITRHSTPKPDSYGIEAYSNGWYRCWLTVTTDQAGQLGQTIIYLSSGESVYASSPQIERGSTPSSIIPDGTTFTSRASTATYIDSTGTLQTAAIDAARNDAYGYVDGVLKPIGLLLEGAATNLIRYSGDFSQWGIVRSAITDTFTQNGVALFELTSTAVGASYVSQIVSGIPSGDLSVSIYTKTDFYFRAENINRHFNITSKTQIEGPPVSSLAFLQLSDGLFRVSFTLPDYTGGDEAFQFGLPNGDVGTVGAFGSINIEEGSYPTSYIPTEGTQVTRAADVSSSPQVTRAADDCVRMLGDEYNTSEGTFVVSYTRDYETTNAFDETAFFITNAAGEFVSLERSDTRVRLRSDTAPYDITSSAVPYIVGNNSVCALSWGSGKSVILAADGVADSSSSANNLGLQATLSSAININMSRQSGSTIRGYFYYIPRALSEAELITLTGGA